MLAASPRSYGAAGSDGGVRDGPDSAAPDSAVRGRKRSGQAGGGRAVARHQPGRGGLSGRDAHTLTADTLTAINPGLSSYMMEAAKRLGRSWFAAQDNNWDEAAFEIREAPGAA